MSMIGNYQRLSPAKLAKLISGDSPVSSFLDEKPGWFSKPKRLDIDKAWHGIHFLLTGSAWEGEPPLSYAVLGGVEIGEEIVYGPARFITVKQVAEADRALREISRDELLSRFDLQRMRDAEIYPDGWEDDPMERSYLGDNYERLVEFFSEAAKSGDAMLKYIS